MTATHIHVLYIAHAPVDDPFPMQVLQAAADLRSVEDGSLFIEARVSHVIDMKLEVTSIHYS